MTINVSLSIIQQHDGSDICYRYQMPLSQHTDRFPDPHHLQCREVILPFHTVQYEDMWGLKVPSELELNIKQFPGVATPLAHYDSAIVQSGRERVVVITPSSAKNLSPLIS